MDTFTSAFTGKKVNKAIMTYMGYFGSRFVGNDIQVLCGNVLDTPLAKSFTLFCIMYQATDNLNVALSMTLVFVIIQYLMSISPSCGKYKDKTTSKHVNNVGTAWPHIAPVAPEAGSVLVHPHV